MNVLLVGAGASRATSGLPTALDALRIWQGDICGRYPLLAFALEVWVGNDWPTKDLETAWTRIDLAWKERAGVARAVVARDLTQAERRHVWGLASQAAEAEPPEPAYYRPQSQGARDLGHSTEQVLRVVAGRELRRLIPHPSSSSLIQETFIVTATERAHRLYGQLLERPDSVISFKYDTLIEQCRRTPPPGPSPAG